VCAIHFDESAYTLKSRLGFAASRGVRHLMPDAVPTLNLPEIHKEISLHEMLHFNSHANTSFLNDHDYRKDSASDLVKMIGKYKNEKNKLLHENKVLQDINATLEDRVKILEDKLNDSIEDNKNTETLLLNRIRSLQEQLRNVLSDSEECVKEEIQQLLTEMFAPKKV
jgi:predicted  nucleic acid-binding Zn-ribbon protein